MLGAEWQEEVAQRVLGLWLCKKSTVLGRIVGKRKQLAIPQAQWPEDMYHKGRG